MREVVQHIRVTIQRRLVLSQVNGGRQVYIERGGCISFIEDYSDAAVRHISIQSPISNGISESSRLNAVLQHKLTPLVSHQCSLEEQRVFYVQRSDNMVTIAYSQIFRVSTGALINRCCYKCAVLTGVSHIPALLTTVFEGTWCG